MHLESFRRFIHQYSLLERSGIHTGSGDASDKSWELEKRIKNDKHSVGVVAEMRRSVMFPNLIDLLRDGAITPNDLEGFSDELRESLAFVTRNRG